MPLRYPRRAGLVLATGQTTSYSSELDDGNYERGLAKRYEVLSTGQYSGTANIDLAHYTGSAGAIAFDNTAKTITDTGNGLAIFKTNDVIVTSATNNPGPFTVTTGNVAGTITCSGATFVTETPAGAITISKREAHSNTCVLDLNTGLMWSSTFAANMGAASDGLMVWTGQLYDIFQYAAAANTASLGGYADWRVPNYFEVLSLLDCEQPTSNPNATAFPGFNGEALWTATTVTSDTTSVYRVNFDSGISGTVLKSAANRYCLLVRAG